jgi:hypothetical protein
MMFSKLIPAFVVISLSGLLVAMGAEKAPKKIKPPPPAEVVDAYLWVADGHDYVEQLLRYADGAVSSEITRDPFGPQLAAIVPPGCTSALQSSTVQIRASGYVTGDTFDSCEPAGTINTCRTIKSQLVVFKAVSWGWNPIWVGAWVVGATPFCHSTPETHASYQIYGDGTFRAWWINRNVATDATISIQEVQRYIPPPGH